MEQKETTFRIEVPTGSVAHLHYDHTHGTVEYDGRKATLPYDRLIDFIHVAEMVGLRTSEL